jgi:DNA-binding response OmpR family regulator
VKRGTLVLRGSFHLGFIRRAYLRYGAAGAARGIMRVLIVEDDVSLAVTLRDSLEAHGIGVLLAHDRPTAWEAAWREPFDVAVLDVMLPADDDGGFHLARDLREAGFRQPVLFLSARDAVPDRVRGLDLGDDYLPKPFALDELLARLKALFRRGEVRGSVLRWRDVELWPLERLVKRGGVPVKLTNKEFEVLTLLMQHPGRVFTRAEILDRVWGLGFETDSNVLDVYVSNLRGKLGDEVAETVRGVGYRGPS